MNQQLKVASQGDSVMCVLFSWLQICLCSRRSPNKYERFAGFQIKRFTVYICLVTIKIDDEVR